METFPISQARSDLFLDRCREDWRYRSRITLGISSEMRFGVLSSKDLRELNKLKTTRSHLALGEVYTRAGLINEAESEFQRLAEKNPQSTSPAKLFTVSVRYGGRGSHRYDSSEQHNLLVNIESCV